MLLETEILDKYKSNQLQGIYVTELCFYMPIRITGTGLTIRKNEDKFYICDRTKELFLSNEIVKACSNIPIIIQHPDYKGSKDSISSSLLSNETLKDNPIIGQTIYAYINDEEIWAIGRIYDFELLDRLNEDIHSTSPAVFSGEIQKENGVCSEIPFIINHIAFVEKGHWDQKSDVAFDDSKITLQGDDVNMSDEIKKDESAEEKVEDIENAEKEEAEHYEEMAKEHKEALNTKSDEGDKMAEQIKKDEDKLKTDETTIVDDNVEDEVKADDNEELEVEIDDEDIKSLVDEAVEEKLKSDAEDEVTGEVVTDEDEERTNIIDTMTELSDSVDSDVGFKKVYAKGREKPSKLLGRILKANRNLLDSKYQSLADSTNYSNYGLAIDAFNNLIENAEKKHKEISKLNHKKSGARWERLSDGISVDRSF